MFDQLEEHDVDGEEVSADAEIPQHFPAGGSDESTICVICMYVIKEYQEEAGCRATMCCTVIASTAGGQWPEWEKINAQCIVSGRCSRLLPPCLNIVTKMNLRSVVVRVVRLLRPLLARMSFCEYQNSALGNVILTSVDNWHAQVSSD